MLLSKLYNKNKVAIPLRSDFVYDVATKKYLSEHINETNVSIAQLRAAIAGKAPSFVRDDITARNALTVADGVLTGSFCWVKDASADSTVDSGAALYLAEVTAGTITWSKVTEVESLDVVLQWANIQGKPSSAVADIDDAVSKKHAHANASVLDGLSANATSGNLEFNNVELNGETGIALLNDIEGTPDFHSQIILVVEEFNPEEESGSGSDE